MARKATASEILRLLRERPGEMRVLLGEPAAHLSMPTDGNGARILATLPQLPAVATTSLLVTLEAEEIEVLVQLSGDYERLRAHRRERRSC
jgi:hypothetical protein